MKKRLTGIGLQKSPGICYLSQVPDPERCFFQNSRKWWLMPETAFGKRIRLLTRRLTGMMEQNGK